MYIFSKATLNFYPKELKVSYQAAGSWPDDGVEVDDDIFSTFTGQPPDGKQRGADYNGYPAWVNLPKIEPDPAAARAQKKQQIEQWRTDQENGHYILQFNGANFDYSKETQDRLTLAVDMAKQDTLPGGFFWTDADNNDIPMKQQDIIAFSNAVNSAMFSKGLQIHIRQREMKKEVDALIEVSDILNYSVGWAE